MDITIQDNTPETKVQQLSWAIISQIKNKQLMVGNPLPPVNKAVDIYGVSRDTVIKVYKNLQEKGWVISIPSKGFYVKKCSNIGKESMFVFFDTMNQYKETLYRALINELGYDYEITTAFHYYDRKLFDILLSNACCKYDHYVVIPHFNEDVTSTLNQLPPERLLMLDGFPQGYEKNCAAVYQDFPNDIYEELKQLYPKLKHYKALHVVYNDKFQFFPDGLAAGMYRFAGEFRFPIFIEPGFNMEDIQQGHCYMAVSERDLASIIKVIQLRRWKLSRDIGIVSIDDTPLKEVLLEGITTVTTDFALMGKTAAQLIKSGELRRICNPCFVLDRNSL